MSYLCTTTTKLNMIEEAQALADRFPDLPDHEVIEHVEYILVLRKIPEGTATWRGIVAAYNDDEKLAKFWLEVKED